MRSETQAYLDKAQKSLVKAGAELEAASLLPLLAEDAARNAYYAAFHAAQALIQERTAKNLKTHNGVHAEFHRLTRDDPSIDPSLRTFLSQAYEFKAICGLRDGLRKLGLCCRCAGGTGGGGGIRAGDRWRFGAAMNSM